MLGVSQGQRGRLYIAAIACPLLLASCVSVQSKYRHDWTKPLAGNALANPKVGAVVLIELHPSAAPESGAIIPALERAFVAELRKRGYDPMVLPAEQLTTSITEAGSLVHIGRVWELRPRAEGLARKYASADGLSGLFVAWVTIRRANLAGNELTAQPLILTGATALEVYSAQGEALYSTRGTFTGGEKVDASSTGTKVKETWRLFGMEETASLAMQGAMRGYFGGIQPFTPSK